MTDELPSADELRIVQSTVERAAQGIRRQADMLNANNEAAAIHARVLRVTQAAHERVAAWLDKLARLREQREGQQEEIRALIERTKLPDVKEPGDG